MVFVYYKYRRHCVRRLIAGIKFSGLFIPTRRNRDSLDASAYLNTKWYSIHISFSSHSLYNSNHTCCEWCFFAWFIYYAIKTILLYKGLWRRTLRDLQYAITYLNYNTVYYSNYKDMCIILTTAKFYFFLYVLCLSFLICWMTN